MNKNAYTNIIGAYLILILNLLGTSNLLAQTAMVDLRFLTEVDCNQDEFAATLQMKVRSDSFRIGTSSILFNYNESVLAIKDYESITFNENNTVNIFGSETPVWSPHKFNSTVPGICNLTLLIDIAAASLPAVYTDWIDIGKVKFDILNLNASPNLTFDIPNTNFNRYDPNDGSAAPTKGDFINYNDLLATQCACSVPTATNDTLNYDCFQSIFTANLISNDVISNPTFSITTNPTKGTASISPNGQLIYNSSDSFCGADQLTYQVCNDGDAQCCAVAEVFINFIDDVPPVFTNPPLDLTVSCNELPVFSEIPAIDVCTNVQILQEESISQGSCANSMIHVRTWTAIDGCGNRTVYTQNITVEDNEPPVISCLEDYLVLCQVNNDEIIDSGTPIYSDNCSDTSLITLTFSDGALQDLVQEKVVGQFIRTWTATDECGNFSTCEQLIQIIDDVAPLLFCPSDITVNCGADISLNSISGAEAYDSCSAVTLSFMDVGSMPSACNFDSAIISRTWVAEDACGNRTECVQKITVQGTPCAATITRERTEYLCEGAKVNLKSMMGFEDITTVTVLDINEQPITNSTAYDLPLTGCLTGTFEFVFQTFNDAECLTEQSKLTIKTIPNLIMSPFVAEDNCSAELVFECPDLYEVTWSNGANSGTGNTYIAAPGQDGVVLFTIKYIGDNLPDSLDLICVTDYYEIDLECQNTTPCLLDNRGVVFDGSEIAGCSFLIELSDGTILEPAIIPEGVTIEAGQELLFSYTELTDRVSVCQSGKIVEIICLENTCPEKGTPCTDDNLATINDAQDGNCNCVGESVPEVTNEINLRFRPSLDCPSNVYCVMIQGKAQQTDFSIGTSSIMVNYNVDALEFVDYTSAQFDENETCIGGISSPWGKHKYDATSVPGMMCLTMILDAEGVSCPEITSDEWEDIGQICFDIMDNDALPNIRFDTSKTHFNSSSPNDGTAAIKMGALHQIDTEDALACAENGVAVKNEVAIKAFLQGAYKQNEGKMDDILRKKGFIPSTEPYTGLPSFIHFGDGGGETTTDLVLSRTGNDAIVDWVFIELRSASDAETIMATSAGLIQRDGDIVDVDGVSNLQFIVPNESYYISVKHRNHLGAMTGSPVDFSKEATIFVDFSDPNMETYGTNAQTKINETMALWGGNANPDKHIILAGGGLGLPDRDMIFFDIFYSLWGGNGEAAIAYNSVLHGYYGSDTNLDGKVKYQGPGNDIDAIIFFNVLFHPENTQFRLNFSILEQIP